MPMMPGNFRPAGVPTRTEVARDADQRRGSARDRGYSSAWDRAAAGHREHHPLCVYCLMGAWGEPSRVTPATCVDHLIPHNGDRAIFWNRRDWVSSCGDCHDGPKQRIERRPAALLVLANAVRAFIATQGGGSKL